MNVKVVKYIYLYRFIVYMKNIVKILIGCILIYSIRGNVVFLVDFVFVYDFFD